MKIAIVVLLILLIIASALVFLFMVRPSENESGTVCIKQKCFSVELATTSAQHAKGLMGREKLDSDSGMFFIYQKEGIYPFWMKDTLIPLDMIWINSSREVVFIRQNAQPCKSLICPQISPGVNAMYVLEINSGISEELDLQLGDKCDIIR